MKQASQPKQPGCGNLEPKSYVRRMLVRSFLCNVNDLRALSIYYIPDESTLNFPCFAIHTLTVCIHTFLTAVHGKLCNRYLSSHGFFHTLSHPLCMFISALNFPCIAIACTYSNTITGTSFPMVWPRTPSPSISHLHVYM